MLGDFPESTFFPMRIGVFGSTGQIGHALCEFLDSAPGNIEVTAFKRKASPVGFSPGVRVREIGDIEAAGFQDALSSLDHAVYAIGSPEKWQPDPEYFDRLNVGLLAAFLEALSRHPEVGLTYVSTFEVFRDVGGVVRESNGARARGATPYYDSMLKAYRLARDCRAKRGLRVNFVHPAAVYGGLNTSLGLTDYLMNLKHGRFWRVPAVPPGEFPIIHVESLAQGMAGIIRQGGEGESYLLADAQVSLRSLGLAARKVSPGTYVPPELPLPLINASVAAMEALARFTGRPPMLSAVQVKYVTQGLSMDCAKAESRLPWKPMDLEAGLRSALA